MTARWLIVAGILATLAVANLGIAARERTLRDGDVVLLELAPVDPRSLMQGDYMALRFELADDVRRREGVDTDEVSIPRGVAADGYAIVSRDADGVASLVRTQREPFPRSGDELAIRYRLRGHELRIATNAWFFEEGTAARWQPARYGELRVDRDGTALLTGLRGADRRPL